jgi:pimeloyl-ACP methyl ester carboxylesterase
VAETAEVILVHGLWYRAWSMRVLARRLAKAGLKVRCFSYPTRTLDPGDNAGALARFAQATDAPSVHFVGHSLGGLLVLSMLRRAPGLPPGRVALLGTPLQGSVVARRSRSLPGGAFLLGRAAQLLEGGLAWLPPDRPTGMIAGVRPVGLGCVVGGLEPPHDGTVAVAETRVEGLADHLCLPVTHTGMLVAPGVAAQAARFLGGGGFAGAPDA